MDLLPMDVSEKKELMAKIERLSPKQRKRVEGYVDALSELTQPNSSAEEFSPGSEKEEQAKKTDSLAQSTDTEEKTLDLSLQGVLSHLKDEYTVEELEENAKQWRIKRALDY